jgi:hypothetical protein
MEHFLDSLLGVVVFISGVGIMDCKSAALKPISQGRDCIDYYTNFRLHHSV